MMFYITYFNKFVFYITKCINRTNVFLEFKSHTKTLKIACSKNTTDKEYSTNF